MELNAYPLTVLLFKSRVPAVSVKILVVTAAVNVRESTILKVPPNPLNVIGKFNVLEFVVIN